MPVTCAYKKGKQEACHRYYKITANNFIYISLETMRHGKEIPFFDEAWQKIAASSEAAGIRDTHRKVAIFHQRWFIRGPPYVNRGKS